MEPYCLVRYVQIITERCLHCMMLRKLLKTDSHGGSILIASVLVMPATNLFSILFLNRTRNAPFGGVQYRWKKVCQK